MASRSGHELKVIFVGINVLTLDYKLADRNGELPNMHTQYSLTGLPYYCHTRRININKLIILKVRD